MREKTNRRVKMCVRVSGGIVLLAVALLAGCAAYVAPLVSPELASRSSVSEARLQRGYEVHLQSCAKCHPFENPADYTEQEWRTDIMPRMADEAELGPQDQQAVLEYLLAARQLPGTGDD